jgi:hypothetical protein
LVGLGDAITREDIKEMLSTEFKVNIEKDGGDIAFITYEKGGAEALVSRRLLLAISVSELGIRDFLVRNRVRGSVALTNGFGSNSGSDFFLQ